MNKYIAILILLLCAGVPASAATTYVSQGGGVFSGGSACNGQTAVSVATFNGNTPAAGDLVLLCGTISTEITVNASGTSGNLITFKWDTGAKVSRAVGSLVNLNSHNYLLFDGGTACGPSTFCSSGLSGTGIIENTANGSGLANQTAAVYAFDGTANSANVEVRNLIVQNLYVHSLMSDATSSADVQTGLFYGNPLGTGWSIHDSTLKDMGTCFQLQGFTAAATISIYNNYCYNMDWGVGLAGSGTRTTLIHDNHFGSTANWDTTVDAFHHDGLHLYMSTSATSIATEVYNNTFDGNWGTCCSTAFVYQEFSIPNQFDLFNNVFNQTSSSGAWPMVVASSENGEWDNNAFICGSASNTQGASPTITGLTGTVNLRNNAFANCTQFLSLYTGGGGPATPAGVIDYNVYMKIVSGGNSAWKDGTSNYSTFAAWQTACSCDAHSAYFATNTLNANGSPTSSFPGIATGSKPGTNLTSISSGGIAALASSTSNGGQQAVVSRPSSGAWDVGAFAYLSPGAPSASFSPTSVSFPNTVVTITSSPVTVTLTNSGTATMTGIGISITGTNAADFSQINTCSSSLLALASCAISVTFTPSATGSRSAYISVADNAAGSPQTVALFGTGGSSAPTTVSGNVFMRQVMPNASSTGTTINTLTKITGNPSTLVKAATTDTSGVLGVTVSGAGTTGNATIQLEGQIPCVFDGATTSGDYVQISSTTAGDCHDAGATFPTSNQVIGRVESTNGSAGTYTINLYPAEINATAGSGGSVTTVFGRSGTVIAATNDYTCAQVTNCGLTDIGTTFGDTTGPALASGSVVYQEADFACTISRWTISIWPADTATIDVWKIASSGTAVPTVSNSITASALPAISTGTLLRSTTLTGWTTSVAAHDEFGLQLKTVGGTATFVSIVLECDR